LAHPECQDSAAWPRAPGRRGHRAHRGAGAKPPECRRARPASGDPDLSELVTHRGDRGQVALASDDWCAGKRQRSVLRLSFREEVDRSRVLRPVSIDALARATHAKPETFRAAKIARSWATHD